MKLSFTLVLLFALAAPCVADERPNVLFIAVDDLNDWIGCMQGHPQALTPNIDRLASRGMLFTNAHCAAPACNPSRAAVFSGRMPNVSGVWSNLSGGLKQEYPEAKILPVAFSQAGYHTAGTGKLLHKSSDVRFDEYQSIHQRWSPFTRKSVDYTAAELPSKGTKNPRHVLKDSRGREVILPINRMPSDRKPNVKSGESFDWSGFDLPDTDWGDTRCTDWAVRRLREKRDQPLFLAVGYYRPHIPLFAPQRFFDRFKNDPGRLPPYRNNDLSDLSSIGKKWAIEAVTAGSHKTVVENNQWQAAVEAYLACVSYVDHEVGRLLDEFDKSDLADNTLIVLWSDHGWHLGEKDHWGKWTGWERSTRVPLIIVPPKRKANQFANAKSVCDSPVGLIDLYPTLLDLCEVESQITLDGNSLAPLLKDPKADFQATTLTMFDEGNVSLRDKRWRYVRYADQSEELYDLENDPNEWNNVAGSSVHADVKSRLKLALDDELSRLRKSSDSVKKGALAK